MLRRRWLLGGLGALAALSALGLLTRAVRPPQAAAVSSSVSTQPAASKAGEDAGDEAPALPPTWQEASRGAATAEPERPLHTMPSSLSPFHRADDSANLVRTEVPPLRLEGIAQGASTVALISGQRLRVGESIEGFELLAADGRQAELFAPAYGHLRLVLQGPESSATTEP